MSAFSRTLACRCQRTRIATPAPPGANDRNVLPCGARPGPSEYSAVAHCSVAERKTEMANGRHVIIRSAPSFLYTNVCYCEHLHVSARLGRPSGHTVQTTAECIAVQIADVRLSVRPVELLLGELQGSRRCGDPFARTSACSEEAPALEGKGGRDRSGKMQELRPRSAPI